MATLTSVVALHSLSVPTSYLPSKSLARYVESEISVAKMYGLEDPLDSPDFDPIAFINQNFPTGDQSSNNIHRNDLSEHILQPRFMELTIVPHPIANLASKILTRLLNLRTFYTFVQNLLWMDWTPS